MHRPAGSARRAREQALGGREPSARGRGHHFLPISFLAGSLGQNFNVLTGSIEPGWTAFLDARADMRLTTTVMGRPTDAAARRTPRRGSQSPTARRSAAE